MSSSFLTQLFDSIDKAKQPESPKDKLLNFEKMIRDDAKAKGYQPRTHLENLCKQSETFANSPLVKMLLGEYDKTKPLLDMKGSPQRVGIFESKEDIFNFIYDLFIGVRSHSKRRGKIRKIINLYPSYKIKKFLLKIVNKTFIGSN